MCSVECMWARHQTRFYFQFLFSLFAKKLSRFFAKQIYVFHQSRFIFAVVRSCDIASLADPRSQLVDAVQFLEMEKGTKTTMFVSVKFDCILNSVTVRLCSICFVLFARVGVFYSNEFFVLGGLHHA